MQTERKLSINDSVLLGGQPLVHLHKRRKITTGKMGNGLETRDKLILSETEANDASHSPGGDFFRAFKQCCCASSPKQFLFEVASLLFHQVGQI